MIEFRVGQLKRSYDDNKFFGDAYLDSIANIECRLELIIDDKTVSSEDNWNLVEFAIQLVKWKMKG